MLDTDKNIDKTLEELEHYFESIEINASEKEIDLSYLDE